MEFSYRQTDFPPDHAFNHARDLGPDPHVVEARKTDRDRVAELVAAQVPGSIAGGTVMIDATAGQPQVISEPTPPGEPGFVNEEHDKRSRWINNVAGGAARIIAGCGHEGLALLIALDPRTPNDGPTSIGLVSIGSNPDTVLYNARCLAAVIRTMCEAMAPHKGTTSDALFNEVLSAASTSQMLCMKVGRQS